MDGLSYVQGYPNFTSAVNGSLLASPRLKGYGVDSFAPFVVSTAMWYENCTAKACVLDRPIHGRSPEQEVRKVLKWQAAQGYGRPKALFLPSTIGIAGMGRLARDYSDMSWVKIPTLDVSVGVFNLARTISQRGNPVPLVFRVRDDEVGPAERAWKFSDVVISSAFLTALVLMCFGTNIYKFVLHLKFTQGLTTAKIFFVIDLVANFMRLWFVTVNPYYTSGFDYTFTTICAQTHVALTVVCTLLLALKWRELLLKTKLHVTLFLTIFKWPFIIGGLLIFVFNFIAAALRGHWYDLSTVAKVATSCLIIIAFLCAVVLFISGIQILMQLKYAVGTKRRIWNLSQTTFLILISGVFLLLWVFLQTAYMILIYSPNVKMITIELIRKVQILQICSLASILICSFLQNMAMPFPSEYLSSSTQGNSRAYSTHKTHRLSSARQTVSRNPPSNGQSSIASNSSVSPRESELGSYSVSPPASPHGNSRPKAGLVPAASSESSEDSEYSGSFSTIEYSESV